MPTYDYRCMQCGEEFSRVMSLKEYAGARLTCPRCNSPEVKQQLTAVITKTSRKS